MRLMLPLVITTIMLVYSIPHLRKQEYYIRIPTGDYGI
ncbi:hypothetical protein FAES_2100 [Fibrella aestuarina BUZ 2]|uniref:Uncharacterized protein n=1 Tax=Fibrella aestuarina BUZ 2 TaxID=1166018 RepID=I0K7K6_9BACT|nr:hypothetical protein FAES_2100 [Fibrella aestuarina BUZ 2]